MKVLVVCSCTSGKISGPFIEEQVESLKKLGVSFNFFLIKEKGVWGYIKSYFLYLKTIAFSDYDLVHAHYGFAGLLASFQFFKPVVTTFHGSDINVNSGRKYSKLAHHFSRFSIFVSQELVVKINAKKNFEVIPCGTDTSLFHPIEKSLSRKKIGLSMDKKVALFSASFDVEIKNYPLAKQACDKVENLTLMELNGNTREQVNLLLNACDFLLLTSFSEGSPQIIKEAMACNCPIISVDVGDVKQRLKNIKGCYITTRNPQEIADKIQQLLSSNGVGADARSQLFKQRLDMDSVADRLLNIYKNILKLK